MLKKANRLAKTKDIKRTTMRGRSFFNPNFVVKYQPSRTETRRFTVTVTTKISKSAVARNRIKRVIRETIRTSIDRFRFGDYIIIVRSGMVKVPEKEIPATVRDAMSRIGLYK